METSIGSLIRKYRLMRGLTQTQLAQLCNLTDRQIVRKYERNITVPRKETLEKICKALGVEYSLVDKNILREILDI